MVAPSPVVVVDGAGCPSDVVCSNTDCLGPIWRRLEGVHLTQDVDAGLHFNIGEGGSISHLCHSFLGV